MDRKNELLGGCFVCEHMSFGECDVNVRVLDIRACTISRWYT